MDKNKSLQQENTLNFLIILLIIAGEALKVCYHVYPKRNWMRINVHFIFIKFIVSGFWMFVGKFGYLI